MFSLICAWTNGCTNNRDASDLRRHSTHYDVSVLKTKQKYKPRACCMGCNFFIIELTLCGLVTPYGDIELGQHWL